VNTRHEDQRNHATLRRLKKMIDAAHPQGWFVGIADDQIIAAAADFHELEDMLRAKGRDPRSVLVVEAGIEYPEYVTIFIGRGAGLNWLCQNLV
jgi:hypothetical protein